VLKLVNSQPKIVEWALEGMEGYWAPGGDAEHSGEELGPLPRLEGQVLHLSPIRGINEDLLDRVEEQFIDITRQEIRLFLEPSDCWKRRSLEEKIRDARALANCIRRLL
jgi:hypothetical protein